MNLQYNPYSKRSTINFNMTISPSANKEKSSCYNSNFAKYCESYKSSCQSIHSSENYDSKSKKIEFSNFEKKKNFIYNEKDERKNQSLNWKIM